MTTFKRVEEYTVACPTWDEGRIVKNGKQGGHQRYRCKTCGKRFREPDAFQESCRFPVQRVARRFSGILTASHTARSPAT